MKQNNFYLVIGSAALLLGSGLLGLVGFRRRFFKE